MIRTFRKIMSVEKTPIVKKNQKGMSLIELIVVIALIAVFVAVTATLATKGTAMGQEGSISQNLDLIDKSLSECKMYKGALPTQATQAAISTVATVAAYVPTNLQTYNYKCTAGGNATIVTPDYSSAAAATAALQKLKDMGLCDTTSTINGSNTKAVDCVLKSQVGNSGC